MRGESPRRSIGGNWSSLYYGPFRNRYRQVAVAGGASEETLYVGGLFERVTPSTGGIQFRHYIPGGDGVAAIHTRSGGVGTTYYVHSDHLGSPEAFTASNGNELVRLSFGAYGERRDGSDWSGPPSAADLALIAGITRRGFTGHEHLDAVGLIHMNGRVYDPVAGRFLSADPLVEIGPSQSPNSYAYVWNNPLTLIDPSGFNGEVTDTPEPVFPQCAIYLPGRVFNCDFGPDDVSRSEKWIFLRNLWAWQRIRQAYLGTQWPDRVPVLGRFSASTLLGISSAEAAESFAVRPGVVDLLQHEGPGRGHTIRLHVGKDANFLLRRLNTEKYRIGWLFEVQLRRAGSFPTLSAANRLVSATLAQNSELLATVASGAQSQATLLARFPNPTGIEAVRTSSKGQPFVRDTFGVAVVVEYDPASPLGYVIKTAYPRND